MSKLKILIFISILTQTILSFTDQFSECRISIRNSFITAERTKRGSDHLTGMHKTALFVDPDQDLWQFQPINNTRNQFRLRNMKFKDQELYASDNFSGMNLFNLKKRRNVYARRPNLESDEIERFVWLFKSLEGQPNQFYIVNKWFREPLFVGTWVDILLMGLFVLFIGLY